MEVGVLYSGHTIASLQERAAEDISGGNVLIQFDTLNNSF